MRFTTISLIISGSLLFSGCVSSYDYTGQQRVECGANIVGIVAANSMASDLEAASGQDVDAYDQGDRDTLLFSLFLAGMNAASSGRTPDGDDACYALNDAADLVYGR